MIKESCKIYKTALFYTNKTKLKNIEHITICKCRSKCERKEYSISNYYTAILSHITNSNYWKKFL